MCVPVINMLHVLLQFNDKRLRRLVTKRFVFWFWPLLFWRGNSRSKNICTVDSSPKPCCLKGYGIFWLNKETQDSITVILISYVTMPSLRERTYPRRSDPRQRLPMRVRFTAFTSKPTLRQLQSWSSVNKGIGKTIWYWFWVLEALSVTRDDEPRELVCACWTKSPTQVCTRRGVISLCVCRRRVGAQTWAHIRRICRLRPSVKTKRRWSPCIIALGYQDTEIHPTQPRVSTLRLKCTFAGLRLTPSSFIPLRNCRSMSCMHASRLVEPSPWTVQI